MFWLHSSCKAWLCDKPDTSRWLCIFRFPCGQSFDTAAIEALSGIKGLEKIHKSLMGLSQVPKRIRVSPRLSPSFFFVTERESWVRWISLVNMWTQVWARARRRYLDSAQMGRIGNKWEGGRSVGSRARDRDLLPIADELTSLDGAQRHTASASLKLPSLLWPRR